MVVEDRARWRGLGGDGREDEAMVTESSWGVDEGTVMLLERKQCGGRVAERARR